MKFLSYQKLNVKRFRSRSDYHDVIATDEENVKRQHRRLMLRLIPGNNLQPLADSEAHGFIDGVIDNMSKSLYILKGGQTFERFSHTIAISIDQAEIVFCSRDA